jgi:hypothetical protein
MEKRKKREGRGSGEGHKGSHILTVQGANLVLAKPFRKSFVGLNTDLVL